MRGSISMVNTAMVKPMFYLGVERELVMANACFCFPFVAATHMQLPICLFGVVLFAINHMMLAQLSKHDPIFAKVFRRYTRYAFQDYFPARSHPMQTRVWPITMVIKP
jgi:type IV secretory pathway TrbD component